MSEGSRREVRQTSLQTPIIIAEGAAAEELVQLTIKVCQAINAREWNHSAFLFLSDNMQSLHDNMEGERVVSRQDHIDAHRRISEREPNYYLRIKHIQAYVNDNETTADVWMDLVITGIGEAGRCKRESVSLLRTRKVNGAWVCWRQEGLRGVAL